MDRCSWFTRGFEPDAALPYRRSNQGDKASAWGVLRGAGKVWTHPIPPYQEVLQGGEGEHLRITRV